MVTLTFFFQFRNFHPQTCVKLDDPCITIHSVQVDPTGICMPLVVLEGIRQITPDHLEYTMKWSEIGEKLAKVVIKLIKDELE